jgi:hypothetical protein|tara:strand:- start:335 stop:571 length:237 start_codon:yes stop_codon:yes gene_type:complete
MTEEDNKKIIEALLECSVRGLVHFVDDNRMSRMIEIVHEFHGENLSTEDSIPAVRITIEPVDKDEGNGIPRYDRNLLN